MKGLASKNPYRIHILLPARYRDTLRNICSVIVFSVMPGSFSCRIFATRNNAALSSGLWYCRISEEIRYGIAFLISFSVIVINFILRGGLRMTSNKRAVEEILSGRLYAGDLEGSESSRKKNILGAFPRKVLNVFRFL